MKIIDILAKLRAWAESDRPIDILFIAVNEVSSDFQIRIFNSEIGYRDTKGNAPKPTYSDPYKKVRERKGRQTKVVDLEFTGALRRSIKTVREQTGVKFILSSEQESKISTYLEKYRGTKIFDLSESEQKRITEIAVELMIKDIKEIFNESM